MLVTTSKNSSLEIKKLAVSFSKKNKSEYINRGKKTINELVSISYAKGHDKIAVIRNKEKTDYIEIIDSKKWNWL